VAAPDAHVKRMIRRRVVARSVILASCRDGTRPMNARIEANPYAAPQSNVDDVPTQSQTLYVVSERKFLLLMIGTLGLYSLYWFYRNWALLNVVHKRYWPIPRAIFAIFFTHALFREVDGRLKRDHPGYLFQADLMAGIYVASALGSHVLGRLAGKDIGSPITDLVSTVLVIPMIWSLFAAQKAINVAEGDPGGTSNGSITGANLFWLVIGGLFWALTLLGLYLIVANPTLA
jgi:hypothetical protein